MEKGKFSQPRPYRDEERQIEEAFRQVTSRDKTKKRIQPRPEPEIPLVSPEDPLLFSPEEDPIPETLYAQQPVEEPAFPQRSRGAYEAPVTYPEEALGPEERYPEEEYPEEEEPLEPDNFLDIVMDFCSRNRKWVMIGLCAAALLLIIVFIAIFALGASENDDGKILENVYIADIAVGGMTKNQAVSHVKQTTSHTYGGQDMIVDLAGTKLHFSPDDTDAKLDVKAAVEAAYDYGRTGTQAEQELAKENAKLYPYTIGLLPYLDLDTDYIRDMLDAYAADSGSTLTQPSYGLEGDYPELGIEDFEEDSAQTLVLTLGTPGITFDVDGVYNQILDAYSLHQFLVVVEDVEPSEDPEEVDLEAIYDEFYVEPVDSTVDMQSFEVIPGSYGYEFDLEAAQKLVDAAQPGDVIRIPMMFIEPEVLDADVLFKDVLGEFQTRIDGSARKTNIRLACEAIDGTVLQPGDTFSFNNTVGKPSSSKGYTEADPCSELEGDPDVGLGICQAATTLYNSVLLADLEVSSRTSHSFPVDYVDYGLDAYVSYNGPDFRFRNNTNYPLQIEAEVSGSYVSVRLLGTEQRDYYVKMDYEITATHEPGKEYEEFEYDNAEGYLDGDVIRRGVTGYSVKTYKLKYSRTSGQRLSRDYEASTRYVTIDYLVAKVAEPETTEAPTEPPTEAPTVPPTTAPAETVPPETTVPPTTVPAETVPQETAAPALETEPVETTTATQPQTAPTEETTVLPTQQTDPAA